jgi:hypothetical protein
VKDLALICSKILNCQSSATGSSMYQKYTKDSGFFLLSHLVYSQIWLNLLVDDCQFGSTLLIILFYFCDKFSPLVKETKGGGANSQKK